MAQKYYILILLLSLSSIPGHFSDSAVGRKGLAGGWQAIKNANDPIIQEIGKFAVAAFNLVHNKNLVFQGVIKGETQIVAGTNFRLTISVKDMDVSMNVSINYQATVFDQPWTHTRNLTSFKPM
ncbi:hypothetical protein DCAR_0102295 [Daucus carota subsp. sativus]|uniref:Cystatin domain-containing protein n=1 Tax=Daucus carota subsp. sativus TaxID=79200 RepID=A0A166H0A8_DAUCS|nr:hypothetical protein DCAR_0102295 [Daucus carota subsp. sativus]